MNKEIMLETNNLRARFDVQRRGFVSMKCPDDPKGAEFLLTPEEFPEYDLSDARWLTHFNASVVISGQRYDVKSGLSGDVCTITEQRNGIVMHYTWDDFSMENRIVTEDEKIYWNITLQNTSSVDMEVESLGLPLLMNQYFRGDCRFKYEQCVLRHTCITGQNSYIYFEKSSGESPILLFSVLGDTPLQGFTVADKDDPFCSVGKMNAFFEGLFTVYPYGKPLPYPQLATSSLILSPGEGKTLSFALSFVKDRHGIGKELTARGLMNVTPYPGMVVPIGDTATLLIDGGAPEVLLSPEDELISLEHIGERSIARLRFGAYGVRPVTLSRGAESMTLQFFSIERVADIYDRHAEFIARNHFENNPDDPCYNGLLMWDMRHKHRINSRFNPSGVDWWAGGSDEIGLVSGLFLSEKNVYRPVAREIEVLAAYVHGFIVERLTEQPGYKVHRMVPWFQMFEPWAGNGADDVWRAFNYVHVINTCLNVYRIAKLYRFGCLKEPCYYLRLAYEYTLAMFRYWMFPEGVGATEYGNMGEMTIPLELAKELRSESLVTEAEEIERIVHKKAHFFAAREYPFGSEMAYDSTAFEAVYAYGKSIGDERVMRSAMTASLSNRGCQPVWYLYNTDIRQHGDSGWNVSYMTQLGAYPIYDYALLEGHASAELIRSYYASYLAGFSIYNSGGYYSDAPENEGASSWIYVGEMGSFSGELDRYNTYLMGSVPMSGESELGFFGALRIAASVRYLDDVLGEMGLGCTLSRDDGNLTIIPGDGLNMRFYDTIKGISLVLNRDFFKKITINENGDIFLSVGNYTKDSHETVLIVKNDTGVKTLPINMDIGDNTVVI